MTSTTHDEKIPNASAMSLKTSTNSNENETENQRKTIIPIPAFCETPQCQKILKIFKYIYVIGVICMGFLIAFLTQVSKTIDTWFDSQQSIILNFLIEDSALYIILVLLLITALKSVGVKDVLGLRTISVVVLSYRVTSSNNLLTLLFCMFIIGILSSVSKLIEYQVIGHELQIVQGTPIEYIFKYARKLLKLCISEEKLAWLDPKWTFEISLHSRYDKSMHVMANLKEVIQPWLCKPRENIVMDENKQELELNKDNKWHQFKQIVCTIMYFIIAVFWTSVIEWVQPITELFLFAHNWSLTLRNVIIIVCSEFADFDKAVEALWLINALYDGGDIIEAKVTLLASKGIFWALGYCLVAPPTLIWAYLYHKKHADKFQSQTGDDLELNLKNGSGSYDQKADNGVHKI